MRRAGQRHYRLRMAPRPGWHPAQCLLVTEDSHTLAGRTNNAPSQVLQYAGRVDGAHGTYQFMSATGIATPMRITRADGSTTTLTGDDFTAIRTGFVAAVIYTSNGDPLITSATASEKNNRKLNTLHLP